MRRQYSNDLFYILDRLRAKHVNPRFVDLIAQTFLSSNTLTPELLRDLRRVTYQTLKLWFVAPWTESIRVVEPAPYMPCQKLEGNHVFYRKPGRRKEPNPRHYKKNVARALAYDRDRQLDDQFLNALQKECP
jgi:hypothetical protein